MNFELTLLHPLHQLPILNLSPFTRPWRPRGMSSPTTQPDSTSYLLRKLHSLSGIVPVGAFLAEHFWSNSSVLVSPEKYDAVSRELQTIPFRPLTNGPSYSFPFFTTASTASTSGSAAIPTSPPIPGSKIGCTRSSATPASSPWSTSAGISTPNAGSPTAVPPTEPSLGISPIPGFSLLWSLALSPPLSISVSASGIFSANGDSPPRLARNAPRDNSVLPSR